MINRCPRFGFQAVRIDHFRSAAVVLVTGGIVFATMVGCNIVGPIAVMLAPPPSKDAEYALADRPTAVFVDDRQATLNDRPLRQYIGDKVSENLQRNGVLEENIPIRTRDTMAVAGLEKSGALLSVEEIGRAVGAEQLIYIEMVRFNIITESDRPVARAELRVRVIDVEGQTQLYPGNDPASARNMNIDLPADLIFKQQMTRASAREAELALCDKIAEDISKLFYKHDLRPLGASINTSEHLR